MKRKSHAKHIIMMRGSRTRFVYNLSSVAACEGRIEELIYPWRSSRYLGLNNKQGDIKGCQPTERAPTLPNTMMAARLVNRSIKQWDHSFYVFVFCILFLKNINRNCYYFISFLWVLIFRVMLINHFQLYRMLRDQTFIPNEIYIQEYIRNMC